MRKLNLVVCLKLRFSVQFGLKQISFQKGMVQIMREEWRSFQKGVWEGEINVRDFIQRNYTPYDGDDTFLAGPTQNTTDLWAQVLDLSKQAAAEYWKKIKG